MKKAITLLLVLSMFACLCVPGFAAEINTDSAQSSDTVVTYGVSESYLVIVPEAVRMSPAGLGEVTISVTDALLASGKQLSVYLTGDSYTSGSWHLTDVNNAANTLAYNITKNAGKLADNDEVMSVAAGAAWNTTVSTTLQLALAQTATQAGIYHDMLTFVVEYGNIANSSLELNEYGFYFNQPYVGFIDDGAGVVGVEIVLYEDNTATIWVSDALAMNGAVQYQNGAIIIPDADSVGADSTLTVSNNGASLTITMGDTATTLTMKQTVARDPQSGSYIADPNGFLATGMHITADYVHKNEVKVYVNGEVQTVFDLTNVTYSNGKIFDGDTVAGFYHPGGNKLAMIDGGEGLVFVKSSTDTVLDPTYNMYYNRLYATGAGTQDGIGYVFYDDGTYEEYIYIAPYVDSIWNELAFLNQKPYAGWYCTNVGQTSELGLTAQPNPYAVSVTRDNKTEILSLHSTEVHEIYWGKTYQTEWKNVEIDAGEVLNGKISVTLNKQSAVMNFIGTVNGVDVTMRMQYQDGVYSEMYLENGVENVVSYDATYETLRHVGLIMYSTVNSDGTSSESIAPIMASVDGKALSLSGFIFVYLPDHNYNSVVIQTGSCTQDAVIQHTCKDCGDTYTETVRAPGHKDKDANTYCDTCGTKFVEAYTPFTVTQENREMIGYTSNTSRLNIPATFQGDDGVWYKVTTIGQGAFLAESNITTITLPHTVEVLEAGAFSQMVNLESFTVAENSELKTIGLSALGMGNKLTTLDLSHCTKLEYIDQWLVILDKDLQTIKLPSQARLNDNVFYGAENLREIVLVGDSTMTQKVDDVIYSDYMKTLCYYPASKTDKHFVVPSTVTRIGNFSCQDNPYLETIKLPDNLQAIGTEAFMHSSALQSITIPNSVTQVGDYAFGFCSSLKKVVMSENVTEIGGWVFEFTAIESIGVIGSGADCELPATTKSFGPAAFTGCYQLKTVDLSAMTQLTGISPERAAFGVTNTFDNCPIETLKLPASITKIGRNCFDWDEETMGYEKPVMSVYITDLEAFCAIQGQEDEHSNMLRNARLFVNGVEAKEITLTQPNNTQYHNALFGGCLSIEKVYVDASVSAIPGHLFYQCPNLTSVVFAVKDGWYKDGVAQTAEYMANTTALAAIFKDGFSDWTR